MPAMRSKRFLLSFITLSGIALTRLSHLMGAAADLNPTADAFTTTGPGNSLAGNNYGGGGTLALSAAGLPAGEFESVLRFDASTAKGAFDALYGIGSWSVQSVTLRLSAGTVNNAIFNPNSAGSMAVRWMQNDGWMEGSGTPNTPGASGITYATLQGSFINPALDELLGTFSYDGSSSGTFVYNLGLPSGFTADLLAGDAVSLRLLAADSAVSYSFNSRSFATAANRPLLSINAVPEPGLLALLMLGGWLGAASGWLRSRP